MPTERRSSLVIRVWMTGDDSGGFLARLVQVDHDGGAERSFAASNPDQVLEITRRWLEQMEQGVQAGDPLSN
jgi:hypothetical protein